MSTQPVTMSEEIAQAICNLKRNPDFDKFMFWMSAVAEQKQHELMIADEKLELYQGMCRSFLVIFNAIEGSEDTLEKLRQTPT